LQWGDEDDVLAASEKVAAEQVQHSIEAEPDFEAWCRAIWSSFFVLAAGLPSLLITRLSSVMIWIWKIRVTPREVTMK